MSIFTILAFVFIGVSLIFGSIAMLYSRRVNAKIKIYNIVWAIQALFSVVAIIMSILGICLK